MRGDVYSLGMANAVAAAAAAALTDRLFERAGGLHVDAIAAVMKEDLTMNAVAKNPS